MRNNKTENVKVCRAALLTILQESKNRVQLICKKYLETGVVPLETRGGARQVDKYNIKKDSIKSFIKTFIPVQKHYCRAKNKHRQYLPSELNITKMWKMYIEQHPTEELKYEYDFFRLVFSENFNIGFDAPYTDKCSTCTRLECELATEKDAGKRETLKLNLKAHKVRADKFYKLLQENNDKELILSYDCQKNLVLPKIPDQAAYYKRQLYLYNFVICEGHSKVLLNSENTFSYLWTENQYAKGSSQIASAVYHRLTSANMENVTTVKLFSDGCGGQNKNTTVVGMIAHWLLKDAPKHVTKVVLLFPVVGHSFIPPDRVFGVLERKFQDLSVINNPNEYTEIIEKHCTVVKLGTDCPVSDWKTLTDAVLKKPGQWHFQFRKAKKFIFSRSKSNPNSILVQGEANYVFEIGENDIKIFLDVACSDDCRRLQMTLDWCRRNAMELNATKSAVLTYTRRNDPIIFDYNLSGTPLKRVSCFRDLCVTMASDLGPGEHIALICSKDNSSLGFLCRASSDFRSPKTLATIFKTIVRPILEYASVI
ncbi:uncharacterized protein LOC124355023 [Homalodisca vitripennis]|uniref:uncharacterized protein LOC124355023 n=1 Tax=Homalodisca vitripennis TaxID=197043 RepID=UPI001EEC318F|nr:uncharacterized protein LOC124355023 [Homalodisca vitripennis]